MWKSTCYTVWQYEKKRSLKPHCKQNEVELNKEYYNENNRIDSKEKRSHVKIILFSLFIIIIIYLTLRRYWNTRHNEWVTLPLLINPLTNFNKLTR